MIPLLICLGLVGGFLSGLLGLGGAVVMIPMMLTIPSLLGVGELTMREVAGLSMIQVLAASISGLFVHFKNNFVSGALLLYIGIPMGVFALGGAWFSQYMASRTLLILFGVLVLIALALMIETGLRVYPSDPEADQIRFRRIPAVLIGMGVGFMSGAVGAGGGFIIIPLMLSVLRIPLKVSIGTSLGIVLIGAVAGSLGKILSMQVAFFPAVALIAGSVPAARLGARCSKKMNARVLHSILLLAVFAVLIQVWTRILDGGQ